MNPLLNKLIALRHEYLILDRNLTLLHTSSGAHRFAYCPDDLRVGEDVRLPFPELVGVEDLLMEILEGRQVSYELKGIARSRGEESSLRTDSLVLAGSVGDRSVSSRLPATGVNTARLAASPFLYFDLYITEYCEQEGVENRLVVFLEDATERMVLLQQLAQQSNETSLLLSSLAASKTYIDRIITSMADALIVTTESGTIKTVNQSAQSLFGYSQDELIGQPASKLIIEQSFLERIKHLSSSSFGELVKDVEVICQTKTGKEIPIAFSCASIQTDVEGIHDLVYIGRDISERKYAEVEMIKALERERELQELKSRFISMTSHEFRNPLTSILTSTELLEHYQDWSEDKKQKCYHRVKTAVTRMTELLDDILIFSKAESGKLKFNPKPLVLEDFCKDLVEEMQLSVGEEHKINLICSGQDTNVCMDEKLLLHILNNLLTNAIKYSPQGRAVRFSYSCQDDEIIFEIQDEGIGIPAEDQERLFESFHRAKNVGKIPGTGLGLAIVKKSVELHGGKIAVNSEVGVGTTFRVTLPLRSEAQLLKN